MFIDEVDIYVKSGDGGDGCVSFRREKFEPRGGPDGGDGGRGASVYIQADENLNTLTHLTGHHHWKAPPGRPGMSKKMHGHSGQDVIIRVPPGTLIYDTDIDLLIKDLVEPDQKVCVGKGGRGGRGNRMFATSTIQAPRYAEEGKPGRERNLHLELKLVAELGLVGMPNAGKSTLLAHVSSARPKVANYPFTTLQPSLGIAELEFHHRLVIADIPGLIEGAHEGSGLGDEFLKHIERTSIIAHIIDILPPTGDPFDNYQLIRNELEKYSPTLSSKPEIIAVNKMDLTGADEAFEQFAEKLPNKTLFPISAYTGKGLPPLLEHAWKTVREEV